MNVGLYAGTLAFWRLDPCDGGVDLSDASGTNHLVASNNSVYPSFRRPLALVPDWEALNADVRGVRQNEGSVFISGDGQGACLTAPGFGSRLQACDAFTVEGWLRMADDLAPGKRRSLCGASGWVLGVQEDSGAARLCLRAGDGAGESATLDVFRALDLQGDYGWKHVALSRKAVDNKAVWSLYVDGAACGVVTTGLTGAHSGAGSDFHVGGTPGHDDCFHGQLDLWRVSDSVLRPADLLVACVPKTLAYWPLDNSSQGGIDLKNRSGAGFHLSTGRYGSVSGSDKQAIDSLPGTVRGKAAASASIINVGSLRFDGSLGQRSLLKAPELGLRCDLTNSFTVEGWFKKDGEPSVDRFWMLAGARDSASGWLLALCDDDKRTRFYLSVSDVTAGGRLRFERFFPNADVTGDSSWHHVALVYDHTAAGKGVWQLYLDGVWQSSIINPAAPDRSHGFPDLTLAGRESFSNSFVGWLDAWRVTDGPLAAEQLLCAQPDAHPRRSKLIFDDPRKVSNGLCVDVFASCRQICFLVNKDGNWLGLAIADTGHGKTASGRVVSALSKDKGRSWSLPVTIDEGNMPDEPWVNGLVTPFGRVYAFYGICGNDGKKAEHKASSSRIAYRYSDDGGISWSEKQYMVGFQAKENGQQNPLQEGGAVFRCDGRPVVCGREVFLALTKMPRDGTAAGGDGWAVMSDNILSERNPSLVRFCLLPEGGRGIRAPDSGIWQSPHQLTAITNGTLMSVFNDSGYLAQSISRDVGKSWSKAQPVVVGSVRRRLKTGGMAPQVFRTAAGRHLLCVSNRQEPCAGLEVGLPEVFVCGSAETHEGSALWSELELMLYAGAGGQDCAVADMIEQEGRFWFAVVGGGRVSLVEPPAQLLSGLYADASRAELCRDGLLSEARFYDAAQREMDVPASFGAAGGGLTLEMLLALEQLDYGTVLFSNFDGKRGVKVEALKKNGGVILRISLFDGDLSASWQTAANVIKLSETHHAVLICDFAAGIVSAVVDGRSGRGEENSGQGWARLPASFGSVASSYSKAQVAGSVKMVRLFNRALRTCEATGNYHRSKKR